jgi:hypothetical protein
MKPIFFVTRRQYGDKGVQGLLTLIIYAEGASALLGWSYWCVSGQLLEGFDACHGACNDQQLIPALNPRGATGKMNAIVSNDGDGKQLGKGFENI